MHTNITTFHKSYRVDVHPETLLTPSPKFKMMENSTVDQPICVVSTARRRLIRSDVVMTPLLLTRSFAFTRTLPDVLMCVTHAQLRAVSWFSA